MEHMAYLAPPNLDLVKANVYQCQDTISKFRTGQKINVSNSRERSTCDAGNSTAFNFNIFLWTHDRPRHRIIARPQSWSDQTAYLCLSKFSAKMQLAYGKACRRAWKVSLTGRNITNCWIGCLLENVRRATKRQEGYHIQIQDCPGQKIVPNSCARITCDAEKFPCNYQGNFSTAFNLPLDS